MRFWFLLLFFIFQLTSAKEIPQQFNTPVSNFTENRGQIINTDNKLVPDVKFYAGQAGSIQAYFTPTRLSYVFPKIEMKPRQNLHQLPQEVPRRLDSMVAVITELYRMDVEFIGANLKAEITGYEQTSEYTNYYLAHCPDGITHVPSFARLVVHDIYPNIDAVWKTTNHGLKYEFVVRPGGDYHQIKMHYIGGEINQKPGLITASTPLGSLRDESPISYQNESIIQTEFQQLGEYYGFEVSDYDKNQPLVIDPMVVWGTYQNGPNDIQGMRVDANGNSIIIGAVTSTSFPASAGAFQGAFVVNPTSGLGRDCYVAKFDIAGVRQWGTYYGGTGFEPLGSQYSTNCLALDANNNIFFTGTTTGAFPLRNATQNAFGGNTDMFVVKLFADGSRDWATYYGGSGVDEAWGITVDGGNNVIVVGWTQSTNFPTNGSVFQLTNANTIGIGAVVKFNASGARQWATYFGKNASAGGANFNYINAVTTDNSGNIYTTGEAIGNGYPTTGGTFQQVNDTTFAKITVASLDPNGQRRWATFHGCGYGNDIICDNNNLYIVGTTQSATLFNVTIGTYIITGIADICIFSLGTNTGNRNSNSWSRLFGGTDQVAWTYGATDFGQSIAFGPNNDIWVGGIAGNSSNFPVVNVVTNPPWSYNIQSTFKGGSSDCFFAQFSKTDGDVKYSTLFGSTGNETGGYALPYGSSSLLFGLTSGNSSSLPIATNRSVGTPYNITIAKICTSYGVLTDAGSDAVLCSGDTLQIGSVPQSGTSYLWNSTAPNDLSSLSIANPKAYPTNTGTTPYKVKYNLDQTDASGCYGRDTIELTVKPKPIVSPLPQNPQCVGNLGTYTIIGMYTPLPTDRITWEARGGTVQGNNTQQTASILWTRVGIDTIILTVTNSLGCPATVRLLVEVTALPVVNAGIDGEICEGKGIQLNGSATGGIGMLTYSWIPTVGVSSTTIPNPVVTPSQAITDYILTAMDSRGCFNVDTVRIIMNPKPVTFAGEDKQICIGESAQLSASITSGIPPYVATWAPTIGLSNPNVSDPIAKPIVTTDYAYAVTDSKGCKSTDTIRVVVYPKPVLALLPISLDFGKLDGCTSSIEKIDSIANNGTVDVTLTAGTSDEPSFSIGSGFPIKIPVGQKIGVRIQYAPVAAGQKTGKITFDGTPCGIILPLTVTGEKLNLAVKNVPSTVDFGLSISCASRIADTVLTITNTGTDVLTLASPVILPPYSTSSSFPQSIKVGEDTKIAIRYAPTLDGNYAQILRFPFSAGACKDTIKVSMNGVSISQILTVSPTPLLFPALSGCETFHDTIITFENTSLSDMRIDSSSGGGMFKITSPTLPVTLKPGAKRAMTIRFEPTTTGGIQDEIQFRFSPCDKRITAQFSGSKQGASFAIVDTLDAGEIINCAQTSSTIKLKIENTSSGGASGGVTSITTGKSITTTLKNGASLANKVPSEFEVTITPTSDGNFLDSILIVLNPCGITKTVYVKGKRTKVAFKADVATVDFGKIQAGSSKILPIVFTNTGTSSVTISSVPTLLTPFSLESVLPALPANLKPNEQVTISVKYTAISGVQTSKVFASGTLPCATSDSIALQGEGTVSPLPSMSATKTLNGGSVCLGKDTIVTARLSNNGGVTLQVQQAILRGSTTFTIIGFSPRALASGDNMDIQIKFTPSAPVGVITSKITWITDLLRDSTDLIGTGKDCGTAPIDTAKTLIQLSNLTAEVGEKITIALVLKSETGLLLSGATKYKAKVRFNKSIIHITNPSLVCLSGGKPELCEVEWTGDYLAGRDTLGVINAEATLGNVERTNLELLEFQWLNGKGVVNNVLGNGEFELKNLCREGGVRLYQSTPTASLSIMPNPSNGSSEIEYVLREESAVRVTLVDVLGQEVMVIDDAIRGAGTYRKSVEFTNTGDGIYYLRLQCPNLVKTLRVSVVK